MLLTLQLTGIFEIYKEGGFLYSPFVFERTSVIFLNNAQLLLSSTFLSVLFINQMEVELSCVESYSHKKGKYFYLSIQLPICALVYIAKDDLIYFIKGQNYEPRVQTSTLRSSISIYIYRNNTFKTTNFFHVKNKFKTPSSHYIRNRMSRYSVANIA